MTFTGRFIQDWFIGQVFRCNKFYCEFVFLHFIFYLQNFYHLLSGCLFNSDSLFFSYCDECGPVYFNLHKPCSLNVVEL